MVNLFHLSSRNYFAPDSSDRFRPNLLFRYFNSYPSTPSPGYLKFKLKNYNSTMHSSPKIFPLRKAHNPLDPSSFHRIIFISAEGEETTRRPVAKPQFRRDATPREKGAGREKKSKRDTAYASLHGRGRDRVENFSKTFSRKAMLAFLGMTDEKFRYRSVSNEKYSSN